MNNHLRRADVHTFGTIVTTFGEQFHCAVLEVPAQGFGWANINTLFTAGAEHDLMLPGLVSQFNPQTRLMDAVVTVAMASNTSPHAQVKASAKGRSGLQEH